mmetsp:Transcript_33531/g.83552  ORF Transcript_33531/g.83552 Transcript_33531/m.83552 type:complete len:200 (-) Transcript_33531:458-1057(-)
MSEIPVTAWICAKACSKLATFSSVELAVVLSFASPHVCRRTCRLRFVSSSIVSDPRTSLFPTALFTTDFVTSLANVSCRLRSASRVSPRLFHSASNSRASASEIPRTLPASANNLSLSSYATLASSITSAMDRFFSARSRCNFLYCESKTILSLRRLSIDSRSSLLRAMDSLNLTSDLSSLFSSTRTCFSTAKSLSAGA